MSELNDPLDASYLEKQPLVSRRNDKYPPFAKQLLIIIGGALMAILGGTTAAFNSYSSKFQDEMGLSDEQLAIVAGLGMLGTYFVLPAGYLLDRIGPLKVGLACTTLVASGYLGMSYCTAHLWPLATLCFCAVGFGLGGLFLTALGTSISMSPSGGGWGVSIVSAAMSLSVAFTFFIVGHYADIKHCNGDYCWHEYTRMFAILCLILPLPGSLLMYFFRKEEYPHLNKNSSDGENNVNGEPQESKQAVSFVESLFVFKDPFFWSLFMGFFVGIGSAVFILSQASQIWEKYHHGKSLEHWGPLILTMFSFCNAGSNLVCGIASDWLAKNKIMQHASFLAFVQIFFGAIFGLAGLLNTKTENNVALVFVLASIGLSFGAYLVIFPTVIAITYGSQNFGKTFAYLEISSSIASLGVPPLVAYITNATGTFTTSFVGFAILLFLSGIIMFVSRKFQKL